MATDSLIGWAHGVINDPTTFGDSLIGWAHGSISDPTPGQSLIGWAPGTIGNPNLAVIVWVAGVKRRVPVLSYQGGVWR